MDYEVQQEMLNFRDFDVNLTTITNLDALLDALIAKGENHADMKDERIPYWADLWASALALSHYLIDNQHLIENKFVFEIGAGLGLPSIVAGKIGAAHVTLTDYLPEAVDFAGANWLINLAEKNVRFHTLDWRETSGFFSKNDTKADVLLASDVAYEARAFTHLLEAFENLCQPDGVILVSEPNRPVSKAFFQSLNTEGYAVKHSSRTETRRGQPFLINLYELKKDNLETTN